MSELRVPTGEVWAAILLSRKIRKTIASVDPQARRVLLLIPLPAFQSSAGNSKWLCLVALRGSEHNGVGPSLGYKSDIDTDRAQSWLASYGGLRGQHAGRLMMGL